MSKNTAEKRSVKLSYLLRHKPEDANLTLNKQGWCTTASIVSNTDFTLEELIAIVESDSKGRYSFCDEFKTCIRANQGHSVSGVDLTFKKVTPPPILFHGTSKKALPDILRQGLLPMTRHHVHLSADYDTAIAVGSRRKSEVVIFEVNTLAMVRDGIEFFISDNGVYLVDSVHKKYLTIRKIS